MVQSEHEDQIIRGRRHGHGATTINQSQVTIRERRTVQKVTPITYLVRTDKARNPVRLYHVNKYNTPKAANLCLQTREPDSEKDEDPDLEVWEKKISTENFNISEILSGDQREKRVETLKEFRRLSAYDQEELKRWKSVSGLEIPRLSTYQLID